MHRKAQTPMRSHLARHLPDDPASPEEIRAMATAAWHKHGIALIRPEDLRNDFDRQAVVNAATKLYGERRDVG